MNWCNCGGHLPTYTPAQVLTSFRILHSSKKRATTQLLSGPFYHHLLIPWYDTFFLFFFLRVIFSRRCTTSTARSLHADKVTAIVTEVSISRRKEHANLIVLFRTCDSSPLWQRMLRRWQWLCSSSLFDPEYRWHDAAIAPRAKYRQSASSGFCFSSLFLFPPLFASSFLAGTSYLNGSSTHAYRQSCLVAYPGLRQPESASHMRLDSNLLYSRLLPLRICSCHVPTTRAAPCAKLVSRSLRPSSRQTLLCKSSRLTWTRWVAALILAAHILQRIFRTVA